MADRTKQGSDGDIFYMAKAKHTILKILKGKFILNVPLLGIVMSTF